MIILKMLLQLDCDDLKDKVTESIFNLAILSAKVVDACIRDNVVLRRVIEGLLHKSNPKFTKQCL